MKDFCPSCERESELTRIRKVEKIKIKGEAIPVEVDYFTCHECGIEFDNPAPENDPLDVAYREYRRRKGMLQPEEIRALRKKYSLNQRDLSELLGFGGATLSRYENGALQDETHDTLLQLIREPANLLFLLKQKMLLRNPEKYCVVMERLQTDSAQKVLLSYLFSKPEYRSKNIYNGFRELDTQRLVNTIKLFCHQRQVYKTVLNQLLFYADFLHFKKFGSSITGLCYAHLPLGPVPDQSEVIFEKCTEIDPNLVKNENFSTGTCAEYFTSLSEPDTGSFSMTELEVLFSVRDRLGSQSIQEIKDRSYQQAGYKQTENHSLISYSYAEELDLA